MPDRDYFNGSCFDRRYYVGLKGYRYPVDVARSLKVDPQTVIPEPAVIALTLGATERFTPSQLSKASHALSILATSRGFLGLGAYWQYTKPELDRFLASSALRNGFTLVPSDYCGS